MASPPRRRLPLARKGKRLGYEKRLRLILSLLSLPVFALAATFLHALNAAIPTWIFVLVALLIAWLILQSWLAEQLLRPLQTLSNVVAALREEDYSFRARGAQRGDSLGDLALEINALAADLQAERLISLESAALVRQVLGAIDAPVLAFDQGGKLRLLNPAAARLLRTSPQAALERHVSALGIEHLFTAKDEQVTTLQGADHNSTQWMVNRTTFREGGVPHTLLLLSDVSLALRQEERQAWQRLIRVLGHEINNSLTPIKSIAGSLRLMLHSGRASIADYDRPLEVIEQRADSLNRFLAAYRQLAQLPLPNREPLSLSRFLEQIVPLETRIPVQLEKGPELVLMADKDQLAQALINLLRNGAEAALDNPMHLPALTLTWLADKGSAVIRIHDSGLGLANPSNLFVPFYTTKQNGTGIGLALVKNIVEAHEGTISLTNHPDGGAQAELRLPM